MDLDNENDSSDDNAGEVADKQMLDVENEEQEKIDEKMWGENDDDEEKEEEEGKEEDEKGQCSEGESQSELVAKDDTQGKQEGNDKKDENKNNEEEINEQDIDDEKDETEESNVDKERGEKDNGEDFDILDETKIDEKNNKKDEENEQEQMKDKPLEEGDQQDAESEEKLDENDEEKKNEPKKDEITKENMTEEELHLRYLQMIVYSNFSQCTIKKLLMYLSCELTKLEEPYALDKLFKQQEKELMKVASIERKVCFKNNIIEINKLDTCALVSFLQKIKNLPTSFKWDKVPCSHNEKSANFMECKYCDDHKCSKCDNTDDESSFPYNTWCNHKSKVCSNKAIKNCNFNKNGCCKECKLCWYCFVAKHPATNLDDLKTDSPKSMDAFIETVAKKGMNICSRQELRISLSIILKFRNLVGHLTNVECHEMDKGTYKNEKEHLLGFKDWEWLNKTFCYAIEFVLCYLKNTKYIDKDELKAKTMSLLAISTCKNKADLFLKHGDEIKRYRKVKEELESDMKELKKYAKETNSGVKTLISSFEDMKTDIKKAMKPLEDDKKTTPVTSSAMELPVGNLEIFHAMHQQIYNWRRFGRLLGLEGHELNNIEIDYAAKKEERVKQCILRKTESETNPIPWDFWRKRISKFKNGEIVIELEQRFPFLKTLRNEQNNDQAEADKYMFIDIFDIISMRLPDWKRFAKKLDIETVFREIEGNEKYNDHLEEKVYRCIEEKKNSKPDWFYWRNILLEIEEQDLVDDIEEKYPDLLKDERIDISRVAHKTCNDKFGIISHGASKVEHFKKLQITIKDEIKVCVGAGKEKMFQISNMPIIQDKYFKTYEWLEKNKRYNFTDIEKHSKCKILQTLYEWLQKNEDNGFCIKGYDSKQHLEFISHDYVNKNPKESYILACSKKHGCIFYIDTEPKDVRTSMRENRSNIRPIRSANQCLDKASFIFIPLTLYDPTNHIIDDKICNACIDLELLISTATFEDLDLFEKWWEKFSNKVKDLKCELEEGADISNDFFRNIMSYMAFDSPLSPLPSFTNNPENKIKEVQKLIKLTPEQLDIVHSKNFHQIIKGPFGSGKTVVAQKILKLTANCSQGLEKTYYIMHDTGSGFVKEMEKLVIELNKENIIACKRSDLVKDTNSLSSILQYLLSTNKGKKVHVFIEEFNAESLNKSEVEKIKILLDNKEFKSSRIVIVAQSMESERSETGDTFQTKSFETYQYKNLVEETDFRIFHLTYLMRSSKNINDMVNVAIRILEVANTKSILPKLDSRKKEKGRMRKHDRSNEQQNKMKDITQIDDTCKFLKHSTMGSDKYPYKIEIESTYKYVGAREVAHNVEGKQPIIYYPFKKETKEFAAQIFCLAEVLKVILNNEGKQAIICLNIDSMNMVKVALNVSKINWTNDPQLLSKSVCLLTEYTAVRGFEFLNVVLIYPNDEQYLKQNLVGCMNRCNLNLLLVVLNKISPDDVLVAILREWTNKNLVNVSNEDYLKNTDNEMLKRFIKINHDLLNDKDQKPNMDIDDPKVIQKIESFGFKSDYTRSFVPVGQMEESNGRNVTSILHVGDMEQGATSYTANFNAASFTLSKKNPMEESNGRKADLAAIKKGKKKKSISFANDTKTAPMPNKKKAKKKLSMSKASDADDYDSPYEHVTASPKVQHNQLTRSTNTYDHPDAAAVTGFMNSLGDSVDNEDYEDPDTIEFHPPTEVTLPKRMQSSESSDDNGDDDNYEEPPEDARLPSKHKEYDSSSDDGNYDMPEDIIPPAIPCHHTLPPQVPYHAQNNLQSSSSDEDIACPDYTDPELALYKPPVPITKIETLRRGSFFTPTDYIPNIESFVPDINEDEEYQDPEMAFATHMSHLNGDTPGTDTLDDDIYSDGQATSVYNCYGRQENDHRNMGVGNMGVGNMGVGNMGVGNMGVGNMGVGNMGMASRMSEMVIVNDENDLMQTKQRRKIGEREEITDFNDYSQSFDIAVSPGVMGRTPKFNRNDRRRRSRQENQCKNIRWNDQNEKMPALQHAAPIVQANILNVYVDSMGPGPDGILRANGINISPAAAFQRCSKCLGAGHKKTTCPN